MLSEKNFEARLGRFTASGFHRLMKEARGDGLSKTLESYVWEKIEETVRGEVDRGYTTKQMAWGNEYEPVAIAEYCDRYGVGGYTPEFMPWLQHAGATPDFIREDGIAVEFKCPYTVRSHYEFQELPILDPSTHPEYFYQTQFQMIVTGTETMEFVSFMPLLPPAYQFVRMTLYRDNAATVKMLAKLADAVAMKEKILKEIGWLVASDYINEEE